MSNTFGHAISIIVFILFYILLILIAVRNIKKNRAELSKKGLSRWLRAYTVIILIGNSLIVIATTALIILILIKML